LSGGAALFIVVLSPVKPDTATNKAIAVLKAVF
jgi:hypothetical protein